MHGFCAENAIYPLMVITARLLHFISLSIAYKRDDFPLPISPNTTTNLPFFITMFVPLMAEEYDPFSTSASENSSVDISELEPLLLT